MSDLYQIVRELRQRLELDRLFGWDVPLSRESVSGLRGGRGPQGDSAVASRSSRPSGEDAGKRSPPAVEPSSEARTEPGPPDLDDRVRREAILASWRERVAVCTRCALSRTRTRTVFGVGDPNARLFLVGEAPGVDEDREGEPFVGKAGRLLNDIIRAMGLRREEVYIANVVKCRPPQNRTPDASEAGSCREYLDAQIEIVAPEVIVALGGVAAKALLGTELSLGRLRGRFHPFRRPGGLEVPLMPTYHPAYLLRYPEEKRKTWEDVQLVMAKLGLEGRGLTQR